MAQVLVIKSSLMGEASNSNELVEQFLEQWRDAHGSDHITVRDFSKDPIPHLTRREFMAFVTPEDQRSAEQREAVKLSDELTAEFLAAEVLVLGVPMYNFGIPSTLKAWIDRIARVGKTFRYTADGPVGLVGDKKVFVMGARGGFYLDTPNDTQTPYLKSIFRLFGLDDVTFIVAEGLNIDEEHKARAMREAKDRISSLSGR